MVPLTAPEVESPTDLLADWLELSALFSTTGKALVRELTAQEDLDADCDAVEIDADDARLESLSAQVADEVERRRKVLKEAYPFSMSADGSGLTLLPEAEWTVGRATYLFSLVLAHAPTSDIVSGDVSPTAPDLRAARDLFQICATLAAADFCGGPAFSFGFPRPDGSSFLAKVKEIWALFGDGLPHDAPLVDSSKNVKDEGIDVVAWRHQPDGKPGTLYLLAQVASGSNWIDKSVKNFIELFHGEWFQRPPATPAQPAIMIPFFVNDPIDMRRATRSHGIVFDRGRLPHHAGAAVALTVSPIERLGEAGKLKAWVLHHREGVLKRCAAA